MNTINWRSIKTAPYDEVILLTGDSGMISPKDVFIITGYKVKDWHESDWNDVTRNQIVGARIPTNTLGTSK